MRKYYEGLVRIFCTFLRRGGGPPPPRMCKIGLAGEALYYYTLLYWGEGSGQYNCRTTWSWLVKVKLLKLCRTTRSYPSELLCALVV